MNFCSPFDEALARRGPAAVFLLDREGAFRFEHSWSRDAWGRAGGPHEHGWTWMLARDRDTGFVQLVLATSPTLLPAHPRLDLRVYDSEGAARQARDAMGSPPIDRNAW